MTAARAFVRDSLRDQARDVVEAVELMACELATNSVQHARTEFELAIKRSSGEIRVEVRDAGEGQPTLRSPTAQEPSGRGLRIVQAMSNAWGIDPVATGKCVWFTLSYEAAPSRHERVGCAR